MKKVLMLILILIFILGCSGSKFVDQNKVTFKEVDEEKNIGESKTAEALKAIDKAFETLDLKSYPSIFVENKVFKADIVGDEAAYNLVKESLEKKILGCQVKTYKAVEDIKVGDLIYTGFASTIDSDTLGGLYDTTIRVSIGDVSDSYNVHEEIRLSSSSDKKLKPIVGVDFDQDEEWGDRVFIPLLKESIGYYVVFDSSLKEKNYISNATNDNPFYIGFLGRNLRIHGASANSLTVAVGKNFFLNAGGSVVVNGKTVTLLQTDNNLGATIDVDGLKDVIADNSQEVVNGLEIRVEDVSSDIGIEFDNALLFIGETAEQTFGDGDAFIGEDENNPAWVWDLANLNTGNPTFGIVFDLALDNPVESDNALYQSPLFLEDSVCLPFDYACMNFESVNYGGSYKDYKLEVISIDLYDSEEDINANHPNITSAKVARFSGKDDDSFIVGTKRTKSVYIYSSGSNVKFYYDYDSKALYSSQGSGSNVFYLKNSNAKVPVDVAWSGSSGTISLNPSLGDDLIIYLETSNNELKYVGHSDGDTNKVNDIKYGSLDISSFSEDTILGSGIIVLDPESRATRDEAELKLPGTINDFKAKVSFRMRNDGDCLFNNYLLGRKTEYNGGNFIIVGGKELIGEYKGVKLISENGLKALVASDIKELKNVL